MVCHSHDDVGWNLTPEEYYAQKVQHILDTVIVALETDERRKFSQAEVYFFERWWQSQDSIVREKVKKLVKEGRLEFVNGGWVASDEACPTFEDFIINILAGHEFLEKEFGI